jgi:hypothetical protein
MPTTATLKKPIDDLVLARYHRVLAPATRPRYEADTYGPILGLLHAIFPSDNGFEITPQCLLQESATEKDSPQESKEASDQSHNEHHDENESGDPKSKLLRSHKDHGKPSSRPEQNTHASVHPVTRSMSRAKMELSSRDSDLEGEATTVNGMLLSRFKDLGAWY